jgi:hypothetical protein
MGMRSAPKSLEVYCGEFDIHFLRFYLSGRLCLERGRQIGLLVAFKTLVLRWPKKKNVQTLFINTSVLGTNISHM